MIRAGPPEKVPAERSAYGTLRTRCSAGCGRLVVPAQSAAWATTRWTGPGLFRRRRSRRCCARRVRCRGAPTSSAAPPRRWTIRRPSSSRRRPAPAWSSWCASSCCWNVRHSAARVSDSAPVERSAPVVVAVEGLHCAGLVTDQNRVSRTRSGRYPEGSSWASSPSMSTSIVPKKLMFSLCAGEMCASTSSSTRRPAARIDSTARP